MTSNKFLHSDGSYWLVSELVKKFLDDGHEVTVLNFYWAGAEEPNADFVGHPRLTLINLNPFKNGGILKLFSRWFLSSFKFYPALLWMFIKKQKFDLFISFSPAFPFWSLIPLGHILSRKSLLIYWDFFPVHNFKIKKLWFKGFEFFFKFTEKRLVHSFDEVGLMSPKNKDFYKSYFSESKNQLLKVIPLWSSYIEHKATTEFSIFSKTLENSIVIIFGGQLTDGRGIIELCHAVIAANKVNPSIKLLVAGDGPLYESVSVIASEFSDVVVLRKSMPRSEYLNLLLNIADIGFVSTNKSVNSPSFPSKSLDYMMCGLPMIAAVEEATDFGSIVEANKLGLACKANDIDSMSLAILKLVDDHLLRQEMSVSAKKFFKKHHYIDRVIEHFYNRGV